MMADMNTVVYPNMRVELVEDSGMISAMYEESRRRRLRRRCPRMLVGPHLDVSPGVDMETRRQIDPKLHSRHPSRISAYYNL